MTIRLDFGCEEQAIYIFIPDGYIQDVHKLQYDFLNWVENQPACIDSSASRSIGLCFNENDFLHYVNEVILVNTNERAYFVEKPKKKVPRLVL